jgi:polyisoprenoid-binding protein YceI
MLRSVRFIAAVAALALTASAATAEPVAYKFDKSHSLVGFQVRHFFSKVPGRFKEFDGTLMIDEKNLTNSSVDVTIQAASIDTEHEKRDTHLRSGDFFDVEKTPTLTFKSTKVVAGEGSTFKIEGDLTMRGVTKPVVLDVENLGMGAVTSEGRAMGTRAGFEATTKVNRKDFGINWNRALDQGGAMLSDDVWITLQIEAIKDEPKPAAAAAGGEKKADTAQKAEGEKKAEAASK